MRAVIALVVIALVTGVFGMSQTQAKIGIVNQMDKVDWEFISKLEGEAIDTGYVPSDNSGVTIGTGVDLKVMKLKHI